MMRLWLCFLSVEDHICGDDGDTLVFHILISEYNKLTQVRKAKSWILNYDFKS